MGLLDYYKQFEDVDEKELNRLRRERRARARRLAVQQLPELDLSSTEWPDLPSSEVVNASIFAARGRVNGYPDRHADTARRALAERHGVESERIVVGNGAAELLQAAALSLMSEGDELLTSWPSYPLYPLMAARAGGRAVTVDAAGEATHERLTEAMGERTRLVVVCNPNDPTGAYLPAAAIASLAARLPDRAHLLVDEALIHFQEVEETDAVLRLTDAFPRLLVIRTFSKIYGLSGLRAGYAVGSSASARLLDAIAPVLGVNALTQAAVEHALKIGDAEVERRRAVVTGQRARMLEALRDLPVDVAESQTNFLWLSASGMSGLELSARLRAKGVIVAPGAPLGADAHIRAGVRDASASDRLVSALQKVVKPPRTA